MGQKASEDGSERHRRESCPSRADWAEMTGLMLVGLIPFAGLSP